MYVAVHRMAYESTHIETQRMWHYVHMRTELTSNEQVHLSGCIGCLDLFKICLLCETPEEAHQQHAEGSAA
jgi:hypothetical protein